MYKEAGPAGQLSPWQPDELGLPKATALALLLVALIGGFCIVTMVILRPPVQPVVVQITQAQLTTLPQPTPPPPPKVIPPPKPLPAVIPKPPPVQSRIVVATKPPPPVRHVYKPVPHPVVNHLTAKPLAKPLPPVPQAPAAPATPAPAPAAPAARTDGIPIYGAQMRSIIEANHNVPQALAQLGLSGEVVVSVVVAPDGHVISASVVHSSGNPLIDQTAVQHTLEASFAAFNADMPAVNTTFVLHIDVQPDPNAGSDDSGD